MYYYLDHGNTLQGPFSENAFEKWYEKKQMPAGTVLYDEYMQEFPIEEVVFKAIKKCPMIIFQDSILEKTLDQTNLDVTLNMDQSYRPNETTYFQPDFTQIEEEVEEVDFQKSEKNGAEYQKSMNLYIERRALLNRRRRIPDTYVPFEAAWSRWVPQPLSKHDTFRRTAHLHNVLQDFKMSVFSEYLEFLNILPHPCHCCNIDFENSFEMLLHFVSIPHMHRLFLKNGDQTKCLSMLDVFCLQKMIADVRCLEEADNPQLDVVHLHPEESYFDRVDFYRSLDSLKCTVAMKQCVPLSQPPKNGGDVCEYGEALVMLRSFETAYKKCAKHLKKRSFGTLKTITCAYCNVDLEDDIEVFCDHIISHQHIQNALQTGVSRSEMEYWLPLLTSLSHKRRCSSERRRNNPGESSLQEDDFPLCYEIGHLDPNDFVYEGPQVAKVLEYIRTNVRLNYPLFQDCVYRTTCRWCHVPLQSTYEVLRHVLYDKQHTQRLRVLSNDVIRRLFKMLNLPVSMPMFVPSRQTGMALTRLEKQQAMQRLKNVMWRRQKQGAIRHVASRQFPMGLVNWCKLCDEDIEDVDAIATHFCSEHHSESVVKSARVLQPDVDYWMYVLNIPSRD